MHIQARLVYNSGELELKFEFIENAIRTKLGSTQARVKLLNYLIYDLSKVQTRILKQLLDIYL
jgi:hypothetical protein